MKTTSLLVAVFELYKGRFRTSMVGDFYYDQMTYSNYTFKNKIHKLDLKSEDDGNS
jgi:hypothetical protein